MLARIAGFAAALAVVFGLAMLAGSVVDPDAGDATAEGEMATHAGGGHAESGHGGGGAADAALPGLAVAAEGFRLVPARTRFASGTPGVLRFRVVDAEGRTVRDFDLEHERRLHLIVVRRDFAGFQHLHPRQQPDGSWKTELLLPEGGTYRAFADFSAGGRSATLATDLFAAGPFAPRPLPAPARVAGAGDGYEVTLDSSGVEGGAGPLRFVIRKDGRRLESVQPYLGADGHLVVLREHDQAFLHVHPRGEPGGRGPISFEVEYPTAGRYRLFLQFKHGGEVHTAAFTQEVGDGGH